MRNTKQRREEGGEARVKTRAGETQSLREKTHKTKEIISYHCDQLFDKRPLKDRED